MVAVGELGDRTLNHGLTRLLCPCGEVLETGHDLRWIGITAVLAISSVACFAALGALRRCDVAEAFVMEAAYLVVLYPAAKFWRRSKQPQRGVFAEMGSVFSGRYDRGIVIAALLGIAFVWPSPGGGGRELVDPSYASIRNAWLYSACVLWLGAMGLMIRDQGLAFFDFRIRNTYADRVDGPQ